MNSANLQWNDDVIELVKLKMIFLKMNLRIGHKKRLFKSIFNVFYGLFHRNIENNC